MYDASMVMRITMGLLLTPALVTAMGVVEVTGAMGLGAVGLGGGVQETVPQSRPSPQVQWQRWQLPSGMRVIAVHAPDAKKQTTFSFQPIHIASDEAGRAQWSHLLEHMLIRTTDGEGLSADGVVFNGETTDTYLRLETFTEPAKWKEALQRHATWLTARTFDAARLEHEKGMIAMEEQSTAANGQTYKFALAAWNQVINRGQASAAVHGDVQQAKVDDVAAYARKVLRLDSSVLIATIGPMPVADVQAEIARLLGDAKVDGRDAGGEAGDRAATAPASQPQLISARWDLPTRHVIWWWPLPDDRPQTRAAAVGVSRALMMRVRSRRDVGKAIRSLLPHATVTTPRGSFMLLNACIAADAKPEALSKAVRETAAALCDRANPTAAQSIVFAARMAAQEVMIEPNFEMLARQVPPQMRDATEGLWLLAQMNFEFPWGVSASEAQQMLMNLDDQAVADVLARLRSEPATLVLEPAAPASP